MHSHHKDKPHLNQHNHYAVFPNADDNEDIEEGLLNRDYLLEDSNDAQMMSTSQNDSEKLFYQGVPITRPVRDSEVIPIGEPIVPSSMKIKQEETKEYENTYSIQVEENDETGQNEKANALNDITTNAQPSGHTPGINNQNRSQNTYAYDRIKAPKRKIKKYGRRAGVGNNRRNDQFSQNRRQQDFFDNRTQQDCFTTFLLGQPVNDRNRHSFIVRDYEDSVENQCCESVFCVENRRGVQTFSWGCCILFTISVILTAVFEA